MTNLIGSNLIIGAAYLNYEITIMCQETTVAFDFCITLWVIKKKHSQWLKQAITCSETGLGVEIIRAALVPQVW